MSDKKKRHAAIRQVVRIEHPATQAGLVALLNERGFDVTQTTISRDLIELDVRKSSSGCYELAEDMHLKRMCADLIQSVEASVNLVIVKTFAGTAQGVAAALDAAHPDGVMGSVAGDDTILIVASDSAAAQVISDTLRAYSGKES